MTQEQTSTQRRRRSQTIRNLRRSTSHCLFGSACFGFGFVFSIGRWWRIDMARSRLVGTVFRSFFFRTRTHGTVNHCNERINAIAVVGRVFRETVLARRIILASTELNDAFVLNTIVEVLETLVVRIRSGVDIRL